MSFVDLPDLAARALGGSVVDANDELFAARDNLLNPEPSTFETWTFGPKGKVYDGWETRRRRTPGHDYATVRLGAPGVVRGVVVDTAHFKGNYPPEASVEGCGVGGYPAPEEVARADWFPLVPRSPLAGDTRNLFGVDDGRRCTHVRLSIYPDGGVARLRVHGEVVPDPRLLAPWCDLAALENGGLIVDCSDMFYGSPNNLISAGHARIMGEGWETARRRDDGNDWVLVRLAAPGVIGLAELDTTHFKGNAPGAATLRGIDARAADLADESAWWPLLDRTRLQPDTRHRFLLSATATAGSTASPTSDPPAGLTASPISGATGGSTASPISGATGGATASPISGATAGPTESPTGGRVVTHVRLDIFPDGGMARLRLYGRPELAETTRRWLAALPAQQLSLVLADAGLPASATLDEHVAAFVP